MGRQESIDTTGVMARRLTRRFVFNLQFIAAAQIHSAISLRPDLEFEMQFEILELAIGREFQPVTWTDEIPIDHGPMTVRWEVTASIVMPSIQIFSVE